MAYRSVGSGPTIVLIMGFSGTMDSWTPQFVAALACSHRVLTFDNAGIGRTAALPTPLSITAMARQTAALLETLGTGRVDVLGWSMGGMIAQALTVSHPNLVRRLVLAATLPGNGAATSPSASIQKRLASAATNPAGVLPLLFPTSASTASSSYVNAIFSWPDAHFASPAIVKEQGVALSSWVSGAEPVGRRIGSITEPTLVADGAEDALVPQPNAAELVSAIHGSHKVIYPHAGHAFLFQDQTEFLARVTAFLS